MLQTVTPTPSHTQYKQLLFDKNPLHHTSVNHVREFAKHQFMVIHSNSLLTF